MQHTQHAKAGKVVPRVHGRQRDALYLLIPKRLLHVSGSLPRVALNLTGLRF
jgi:hypothetical protein